MYKKTEHALLRNYTTFQLGGPCRALYDCAEPEALREMVRMLSSQNEPFMVMGQGSNLLIADEGLDLSVVRYFSEEAQVEISGNRMIISGGSKVDDLARSAIGAGLGDLTFCSGIPGTVGGAIAGNAGAFGQQIGDVLESVELLAPDGSVRLADAAELDFSYRHSALKETGEIVLRAFFELKPAKTHDMTAQREEIMQFRRERHPDWKAEPCAGSFFRNIEPSSKAERRQAAGYFLEQAGADRLKVGGAYVFAKHANMLIAGPDSTAAEVFALSEQMRAAVKARFGIELIREVRALGNFDAVEALHCP
jgi:UDP-N-acetylmuramate dehydrogenase